uniref:Uncharacterized protein n=1 Tax=Arundo donax TaxID=35708 RepID=A0A0A9FHM7_ARUDO
MLRNWGVVQLGLQSTFDTLHTNMPSCQLTSSNSNKEMQADETEYCIIGLPQVTLK